MASFRVAISLTRWRANLLFNDPHSLTKHDRRASGALPRVLPAAVPPDSGERRVVGTRVHGLAERCCAPGPSSGTILSLTSLPTWVSTTSACPRLAPPRPSWRRSTAIHGFCYYHYWFEGRRLLERPFDDVLRSSEPDLPFALCWANENWTRVWTGGEREVLLRQTYSFDDDLQHIRWLTNAFDDPRYIRVNGRPLFLVYRPSSLPDAAKTAEIWRSEAQRSGVGELYLCAVHSNTTVRDDPALIGFDAAVEFQPDFSDLGPRMHRGLAQRAARKYFRPRSTYRCSIEYTPTRRSSTAAWRRKGCPSSVTRASRRASITRRGDAMAEQRSSTGPPPVSISDGSTRRLHASSPTAQKRIRLCQCVERMGRGKPLGAVPAVGHGVSEAQGRMYT